MGRVAREPRLSVCVNATLLEIVKDCDHELSDPAERSKETLMFALIHLLRKPRSTINGCPFAIPIADPVDGSRGWFRRFDRGRRWREDISRLMRATKTARSS